MATNIASRAQVSNGQCDEAVFFSSLGYWLDIYADAKAAAAAAEDEFMRLWLARLWL